MAITFQKSDQITNGEATPIVMEGSHTLHGRLRVAYFKHTQSGAGDMYSEVELVKLPAGTVRLLGLLSFLAHNWTIALVDMQIGWKAYTDIDGNAVTADAAGLDADVDVDAAGTINIGSALAANAQQKVFQSRNGITIYAQSLVAGLAVGDTVEGFLVYVLD